jgi:hypothetical protein
MKTDDDMIAWEGKMHKKAERIKYKALRAVKRTWRPRTAAAVIFFIICTFIPLAGGCSSRATRQQQLPQVDDTPSAASLHEAKIDELRSLLKLKLNS